MKKDEIKNILEKIKGSMIPLLNTWKNSRFKFLKELENYCKHDVYDEFPKANAYVIHEAKTKRGYSVSLEKYFHRSDEDLLKMIEKDVDAKLFAVERAIYKKLKNVKVEKVDLIYYSDNAGAWNINNDKTLSFEHIIAGGWNIQCLHIRTIFKYK